MSWLKKGPAFGALGGLLLLSAFVFCCFDPLLKRALVSGGQAAAGAKVEIGSVRSKWLKGTLEIGRIAIADREEPMRNVVELSRAAFSLDVSAALRGKAVVREAALEGLRLGTERATSGALPHPPPPSALTLAVRRQIAPARDAALAGIGAAASGASAEVDAAKLASLRKLEEAKAKSADVERRWADKAGEIKAIEREAREIAAQMKALGGGSSPGDVLKTAQSAKQAADRLKALVARVDAQTAEARKDLAEVRALLREADELRRKDLDGLLASAGLPALNSTDLARRLLGAQTAVRLSTALKWLRWARETAAARKAASPPPPPRRRGVDVEFPRAHGYPQFLLENARISGALDGAAGGALELQGRLSGVTSNPRLYGKPATLALSGLSASGPAAALNARLDQQTDPVGVALDFSVTGVALAGTRLGDGEIGGTITRGTAAVKGRLASAGDEWNGRIELEATGLALEPEVALTGPAGGLVADALRSLSRFSVRVGVSGREDDLRLSFSSNAGDAVAAAMRTAVSGRLDARKKALEAKLAAAYGGKFQDARASADGLTAKLLGPLDAQKNALNGQLQDALGRSLGKSLRLDRLFK